MRPTSRFPRWSGLGPAAVLGVPPPPLGSRGAPGMWMGGFFAARRGAGRAHPSGKTKSKKRRRRKKKKTGIAGEQGFPRVQGALRRGKGTQQPGEDAPAPPTAAGGGQGWGRACGGVCLCECARGAAARCSTQPSVILGGRGSAYRRSRGSARRAGAAGKQRDGIYPPGHQR